MGVENGSGVPCLTALVVLFATFVFLSGAVKPISPVPPAFFIKFFVSISALTLLYAPLLSPGNSLRFTFALFIFVVNCFAFFDTSDCLTGFVILTLTGVVPLLFPPTVAGVILVPPVDAPGPFDFGVIRSPPPIFGYSPVSYTHLTLPTKA